MNRNHDRGRAQRAFRELLASAGCRATGELKGTPARAAALWHEHLLKGEGVDLAKTLGRGIANEAGEPVSLLDLDVHLVCPHHLTVAFGKAHVGYWPSDRIVSFGRLAELVEVCTARLVLQEEATAQIATALREHLGARAAVCAIEAVHPCHNVTRPRQHRSRVLTWANAGPRKYTRELRDTITAAVRP